MRRLERLQARRIDEMVRPSMAHEVYKTIKESDSVKYAVGAMQPIDPEYTKKTFSEGDRVKNQLVANLSTLCEYEYQGSLTTDTHIKAQSDVDMLAVRLGWHFTDTEAPPTIGYGGNSHQDMLALRTGIASTLRSAFYTAKVDESGATCVNISGGTLARKVDVVPAVWFNTNEFVRSGNQVFRGVQVYNKDTAKFNANTPRLHKSRVEAQDQLARGGLRKAVRLLKTLMYDSEGRVTMSSFNIMGIAYNIPYQSLIAPAPRELAILEACFEYCTSLRFNHFQRASIMVPDGSRTVFGDKPGASLEQLDALIKEMSDLRQEILTENIRSFTKMVEARVEYAAPTSRW